MVPLGAKVIDTSDQTPKESSEMILDHIRAQMRAEGKLPDGQ
jgi:hypothetical protein